jgi:hypothetical protein
VSEIPKPAIGDVQYRAFVVMRAILSDPEELGQMIADVRRIPRDRRIAIVKRLVREEERRLAGLLSRRKRAA